MTCSSIEIEEEKIQKDIQKLEDQIKVKSLKNTTLFYLALPTLGLSLLFADFTGEEKEQISLYNDRIKHLGDIEKLKCASQP